MARIRSPTNLSESGDRVYLWRAGVDPRVPWLVIDPPVAGVSLEDPCR
jgi:hypothetical protein